MCINPYRSDGCPQHVCSRPALRQTCQAVKVIAVSALERVARQEPIDDPRESPRNFILVRETNASAGVTGIAGRFQFPALRAAHTVLVFKAPFKAARLVECRHHRCMGKRTVCQFTGNADARTRAKFRSTALSFKRTLHLRAIPIGHSLRNEEDVDVLRRRRNGLSQNDSTHVSEMNVPRGLLRKTPAPPCAGAISRIPGIALCSTDRMSARKGFAHRAAD